MLKFAIRNLLSRPLRSFLSLLGMAVAIAGMVGLFSVARGLERMVGETFDRIPGLVVMQPGAPLPLFSKLPAGWGEDIAALPGVRVVDSQIWERVNVIDGRVILSPPRFVLGVDLPQRLQLDVDLYREALTAGRFLTLADRGTLNCVISQPMADEFHKGVGDALQVNGQRLPIVGVYFCNSLLLDVAIVMDIDEARQLMRYDPRSVSNFYVEAAPGVDDQQLAQEIRQAFYGRKIEAWRPPALLAAATGSRDVMTEVFASLDRWIKSANPPPPDTSPDAALPPSAAKIADGLRRAPNMPVEVRAAEDWTEHVDHFTEDLDTTLLILTSIGVTIAVLSIINTMVMSVTERIIEIGILKANGWSKLDVMRLISFESALLGLGGGLLGASLGWLGAETVNWYFPTRANLYASPGLLAFSVIFSTALGLAGGLYPALWAMRMMPMDAIRRG